MSGAHHVEEPEGAAGVTTDENWQEPAQPEGDPSRAEERRRSQADAASAAAAPNGPLNSRSTLRPRAADEPCASREPVRPEPVRRVPARPAVCPAQPGVRRPRIRPEPYQQPGQAPWGYPAGQPGGFAAPGLGASPQAGAHSPAAARFRHAARRAVPHSQAQPEGHVRQRPARAGASRSWSALVVVGIVTFFVVRAGSPARRPRTRKPSRPAAIVAIMLASLVPFLSHRGDRVPPGRHRHRGRPGDAG